MRTRVIPILLLGLVCVAVAYGGEHQEGWFESIGNRISSWMPWSSKLGHDWSDTHQKVENIYERSHDEAQRRVEELKEASLKTIPEVQRHIAEIYAEAAGKAEREIESLKHPMLEWFTHWRKRAAVEPEDTSTTGTGTGTGRVRGVIDKTKDIASKVQEDIEGLPKKLSGGYKTALDQAKSSVESLGHSASTNWEEAKTKAAQAYSEAFHKGHGAARTTLGSLRDVLGRGISGTKHMAESAACKMWNLVTHSVAAVFWSLVGVGMALWGCNLWARRRFNKQLNSHVSGPVVVVGEYMVFGDEAAQRKFYEYWSGPANAFFSRQPGMRKHWMHRGITGADNSWICYSEWDSVDALRRAHSHPEFADIRKRGPKPSLKQMTIYQLNSVADGVDGQPKETVGLRQRTTTTTATQ